MGLRSTISKAVDSAFKGLGDLSRPVTYHAMTGPMVRDLVAGTATAGSTTYILPRTVFTKFKEHELSPTIIALTDEKLLFPASDLPVTPNVSDTVVDESGRIWEVKARLSDPASALVTLQMRTTR